MEGPQLFQADPKQFIIYVSSSNTLLAYFKKSIYFCCSFIIYPDPQIRKLSHPLFHSI